MMLVMPQTFFSGSLKLEGAIHIPQTGEEKLPAVVTCHPHPLYGGNMINNVVIAVCQTLVERNIVALRFNFRGVGSSEGKFDDGKGEQDDLRAALAALSEHPSVDPDRLGVMGYSFGGMVALAAAKGLKQVRGLAAVSPVVTPGLMDGISIPAYFICGTDDHVISTDMLIREAKKMTPPGQVDLVRGADHLWIDREEEMADKVAAFLINVL
jgi:uncharacterized protein